MSVCDKNEGEISLTVFNLSGQQRTKTDGGAEGASTIELLTSDTKEVKIVPDGMIMMMCASRVRCVMMCVCGWIGWCDDGW